MAYHHACYESSVGKTAKKAIAKYSSVCQVCQKPINVGDAFTWTRRAIGGAKAASAPTPEEVEAFAAEEACADEPEEAPESDASALLNPKALAKLLVPHLRNAGIGGLTQADKDALIRGCCTEAAKTIQAAIDAIPRPTRIEVVLPSAEVKDCGVTHYAFPLLLKAIQSGENVWMAGPSGSGKTTAVAKVAEALNRKFYYTGALADQYGLCGYKDANGNYVRTLFREAYEHGGIFLLDEVDACDPTATLWLNASLANGHAAFPDAVVKKHPECVIIAAANTYGHGGTHEYVGRNKLDTAFLKRFVFLAWDYDWDMVMATAPNEKWTKRVQAVSERVIKAGIRVLVTPREAYSGAKLLAAGIDQKDVEAMTIRSGMTEEQWNKVCK